MPIRLNTTAGKRIMPSEVRSFLARTWQAKETQGRVAGDFSTMRQVRVGPYELRLCPWRKNRPQSARERVKLLTPHQPCLFDEAEVSEKQTIAILETDQSSYLLFANLFPISRPHYLVVSPPTEPPALLTQIIHSSTELATMFALQESIAPTLNFAFNSHDAEHGGAGATINHFHLHVFEFGSAPRIWPFTPLRQFGPIANSRVRIGELRGWPARHRIFTGRNQQALGEAVHTYLQGLHQADNAYNLIMFRYPSGRIRVAIVPRGHDKPVMPIRRAPIHRFGSGETMGTIILDCNSTVFEDLITHPAETETGLDRQLEEISVSEERLAAFDQAYIDQHSLR
ncbi:MAG: hypothetical protein ABIE84_05175 [bacterium]